MKNPLLRNEIRNRKGELHFKRWGITTPWLSVYIHYIGKSDNSNHTHDHPWDFMSVILWGRYGETIHKSGHRPKFKIRDFFQNPIAFNKAEHSHKILLCHPVYTFVIAGRRKREWGYLLPLRKPVVTSHEEWLDSVYGKRNYKWMSQKDYPIYGNFLDGEL